MDCSQQSPPPHQRNDNEETENLDPQQEPVTTTRTQDHHNNRFIKPCNKSEKIDKSNFGTHAENRSSSGERSKSTVVQENNRNSDAMHHGNDAQGSSNNREDAHSSSNSDSPRQSSQATSHENRHVYGSNFSDFRNSNYMETRTDNRFLKQTQTSDSQGQGSSVPATPESSVSKFIKKHDSLKVRDSTDNSDHHLPKEGSTGTRSTNTNTYTVSFNAPPQNAQNSQHSPQMERKNVRVSRKNNTPFLTLYFLQLSF